MYPAISISDLLEIPFPHISLSTRQNIVKFVSQAKTSSQESKRLLESARRAVEAAIEG
jgi:restriction endonuclease S subunit